MPPYVPLINQKQFYNRSNRVCGGLFRGTATKTWGVHRTFMMLLKDGAAAGRISGIIADFLTSTNDYQQGSQ